MSEATFTNHAFRQHLAERRLMAARCTACGALYVPPRPLCKDCFGDDMEWVALSGAGTLAAFTVVHIASAAMIEAGYGRDNPHVSGIVQLAEGPFISAQIVGLDAQHPEAIAIGTPLTVTFLERGEGEVVLAFAGES